MSVEERSRVVLDWAKGAAAGNGGGYVIQPVLCRREIGNDEVEMGLVGTIGCVLEKNYGRG